LWSVAIEAGLIRHRPVTDGKTVAAAAHDHLIAFAAETGETLWDRAQPFPITEIQACDHGPVIALGDGDDVELLAFGWTGEPLWQVQSGIGTGGGRLRGCGSMLAAIGVPSGPSTRQICQVRDAQTGERLLEFPCNGDVPHMADGRFVYSEQSFEGEGGGLFVYDPKAKKARRLLDAGNSVRIVEDGIAVIDTASDEIRFSRLIAVDLASGKVIWEEEGGPNLTLSASEGQLACALAVDDRRLSMTLRELKTGRKLWVASAVEADAVAPILAADCVLGSIAGERIDIYSRSKGELIQSLDEETSLVLGGCLTTAGYVDARTRPRRLICFAGAAA
jgi:outer membrane protein assembly factor BamB